MGLRVKKGGGDRFVDNASIAAPSYIAGIEDPRKDWAKATSDGASNYEAGIKKSIADKSFQKGVRKAGSEKWRKGALDKGADRYASGVRLAKDAYEAGMAPFISELESITLPPRYPKGDPRNIARVATIADKLHAKKLALKG